MITQEQLKSILHYDPITGVFTWLVGSRKGKTVGAANGNGYIQIQIKGSTYQAHRLAWLYSYGMMPVEQIDHRNKIKSDNWIANLRIATKSQNQWNKNKLTNNTTGYKGVIYNKSANKYQARIGYNNNQYHLGTYDTAEHAAVVYMAAEFELFGSYASIISE